MSAFSSSCITRKCDATLFALVILLPFLRVNPTPRRPFGQFKVAHCHSLAFQIRAVNRISDLVNAQFNVPSTILVAGGASQQLAAQAARLGGRRVLLVTDATMVASGLVQCCVDQLAAANIPAA